MFSIFHLLLYIDVFSSGFRFKKLLMCAVFHTITSGVSSILVCVSTRELVHWCLIYMYAASIFPISMWPEGLSFLLQTQIALDNG